MVCLRTAQAKLIRYFQHGESEEYYDIAADPDEQHNALGDPTQATAILQLHRRLEQTLERVQFAVPDSLADIR
jgi:hypothetical protein